MERRQQILIGVFLISIVGYLSRGALHAVLVEPFQTRAQDIERLEKSVKELSDERLELVRAQKTLKEYKAQSLPPDRGKSKQPTALDAQRLYNTWLTDLAQSCGFESLKVDPGTVTPKGKVYLSVFEKINAEARYEQLVKFLDLFYRTQLIHRVAAMHVSTKVFEGDPTLTITLDIEAIALIDAPPRRRLFPTTALAKSIGDDDTRLEVSDLEDFPKDPGFTIQIKNEFLKVTALDGKSWTVERGAERTQPDRYSEETGVELIALKPGSERTLNEFRELVAANIFVQPAPPYKVKIGPLAERTFTRGRSNDFTIGVQGYDTVKGRPEFSVIGGAPPGLKLDRNGKISWKPAEDLAPGKYDLKFAVRHPSIPDGTQTETLSIRVKEAARPPRLAATKPVTVYLNRKWTFRPELDLPEGSNSKYTWKLGDRLPDGVTIDASSGELNWLPGDETPLGEITIPVIVTDRDAPPQSTTLNLKINVEDDAAQFTRLTGIFAIGDKKRVFLTDQSTAKRIELHEGDNFAIAGLSGSVKHIGGKSITISLGSQEARWDVGQSLREVQESITPADRRSF